MLVKQITVHTEVEPEGKKAKVLIEYRFPAVVNDLHGHPWRTKLQHRLQDA